MIVYIPICIHPNIYMKEYDIKRYTGQHQCFFSHGIKTSRKQTGQSTSEHWKQILKKALGPLKLLKHHYFNRQPPT